MAINHPFNWHLKHQGYVVLDGAMATELEHRGCDLNHPLWSAKVLIEQPNLIEDVHYDYFVAGADCAITASYQASVQGFEKYNIDKVQAIELIKKSVQLARQAKLKYEKETQNKRPLVIAGSVGPYGAFLADGSEYTGNYNLPDEEMQSFHADRIKALIEAGADIIAFETMPSFAEIKVLVNIIMQYLIMPCWFSFTLKDANHLSDGTRLKEVLEYLKPIEQVVAVGINCISLDKVTEALKSMQQLTEKPLIVYPNSGEVYNAKTKTWRKQNVSHSLCSYLSEWKKNGAKLIGGCCKTTPKDINEIVCILK